MKVLILGGTSFFGREIVRYFVETGHEVTLFTRGTRDRSDLPKHEHLTGNRENPADLEKAANKRRWDIVIDNIAFQGDQVKHAIEILKPKKRYLLTSTVSVYQYARTRCMPLDEDSVDYDYMPAGEDPKNVHWSYCRGKLEAERAVRTQSMSPWTIIRPTVVYGPRDSKQRGWWYLERLRTGGPILLPDGGHFSFRMVYSKDVAKLIYTAATSKRSEEKVYNAAQSEIITLRDFLEVSARAMGVSPTWVSVPTESLGDWGGTYANLTHFIPDITRAVTDLNFTTTPWERFVEETAHWYLKEYDGDRSAHLKTRGEELRFATQWLQATTPFPPQPFS